MTVIRLSRTGSKHNPKYRIVVVDSRKPLKGSYIDLIGHYDPLSKDKKTVLNKNRYESWVKKGAQPSQRVQSLFKKLN